MTPRTAALRFRIWQHCEPIGWDCTMAEVAEALEVDVKSVGAVVRNAGWAERFRVSERSWKRDVWHQSGGEFYASRHIAEAIAAGRLGVEV